MALALKANQLTIEEIIRPGSKVEILPRQVLEEPGQEMVRTSLILGEKAGDLVLSLPDPPLPPPLIGLALEVSFVLNGKDSSPVRYGYYTLVLEAIEAFKVNRRKVQGMVVLYPRIQDLEPTTTRRFRRLKVPKGSNIKLQVAGFDIVKLRDISLGGLRFRHTAAKKLALGDQVSMLLSIKGQKAELTGVVATTQEMENHRDVAVTMDPLTQDIWSQLVTTLL